MEFLGIRLHRALGSRMQMRRETFVGTRGMQKKVHTRVLRRKLTSDEVGITKRNPNPNPNTNTNPNPNPNPDCYPYPYTIPNPVPHANPNVS